MGAQKYPRYVETRALAQADAERLEGAVAVDGELLSAREILALPNVRKVHRVQDIHTGEMKLADENNNHTRTPFFVFTAGQS